MVVEEEEWNRRGVRGGRLVAREERFLIKYNEKNHFFEPIAGVSMARIYPGVLPEGGSNRRCRRLELSGVYAVFSLSGSGELVEPGGCDEAFLAELIKGGVDGLGDFVAGAEVFFLGLDQAVEAGDGGGEGAGESRRVSARERARPLFRPGGG